MSRCPDNLDLERFDQRLLPDDEVERIRSHLVECTLCSERLADLTRRRRSASPPGSSDVPADNLKTNVLLEDPLPGDASPAGASRPPPMQKGHEAHAAVVEGLKIPGHRVLREIHRGGQGVIYQAIQETTRRKVAIKILLEGPLASEAARKRFQREIDLVVQFHHPNIITIFDSGTTADGRKFYVMDLIQGAPLTEYAAARGIGLEDRCRLFAQVCRAMHYAHQRGVIHRDLKPANILVDDGGVPRILDFGLAKPLAAPETLVSMTGAVFGTLPYMSPEQATGATDCVDARTDVYALGVILYELLTGSYPYPVSGQIADVLRHIAETPPSPPSRVWKPGSGVPQKSSRRLRRGRCPIDDEIETIILRCLAKEPRRRYSGADAVADDIDRYLRGEAIQAKRESSWYVLRKSLPRYKTPIAVGAIVLVAAASAYLLTTQRAGMTAEMAQRQSRMDERLEQQRDRARASLLEQCQGAVLLMDAARLDDLLDQAEDVGLDESSYECYRGWARTIRLEADAGLRHANRAIELNPTNGVAYCLRASIHAYKNEFAKVLIDFAKADKYDGGTMLEVGLRGMLKGLLQQYDDGIRDLDKLVADKKGSGAVLWIRGFLRWFHLVRDPPVDVDQRWEIARLAMEDINASSRLYSTVSFVFDTRADLHARMALLARARDDLEGYERHMSLQVDDAETLRRLGAAGNADRILNDVAFERGQVAQSLRYAESAYAHLTATGGVQYVNAQDALMSAIRARVWNTWILGDDAAARRLALELKTAGSKAFNRFEVGFVAAATLDGLPDRRAAMLDDASELPARDEYGFGLWAGARFSHDVELADHIAQRLSVELIDNVRWLGTRVRFIRGGGSDLRLFRSARGDLYHMQEARLVAGLAVDDPAKRIEHFRKASSLGHSSLTSKRARGMLMRMERSAGASVPGDGPTPGETGRSSATTAPAP